MSTAIFVGVAAVALLLASAYDTHRKRIAANRNASKEPK